MAENRDNYKPSAKYAKLFEGGSLYRRKDGYLVFQKYETDENEEYRRLSFAGKTEEQVAKKYREFLKKVRDIRGIRQEAAYIQMAGVPYGLKTPAGIDPNISLSDWVFYYIQTYKTPPAVKRTTYSSYMKIHQTQIQPFFGKTPLAAITDADIQVYLNYLQTKGRLDRQGGLSPKSIYNIFVVLNAALEKARGKIIFENPAADLRLPEIQPTECRALTVEEMKIFIEEIFSERLRVAMLLSLFTGARMGEVLALEWGDLNAKKRIIRIIQKMMGHASIVTTEKYSHVLDDEKRKAIDRMSGFLSGMGNRCRTLHSRQKNFGLQQNCNNPIFRDRIMMKRRA